MFRCAVGGRAVIAAVAIWVILISSSPAQASLTKPVKEETENAKKISRSLQSCNDNSGMTFLDASGVKRGCTWLALALKADSSLRGKYCETPAGFRTPLSAVVCPKTCGKCPAKCKDTSAIIGTNKRGRVKKCKWVKAKQKRLDKYCSKEPGFNKRADVACPKTCGKCGGSQGGGSQEPSLQGPQSSPQSTMCNPSQVPKADPTSQSCKIVPKVDCATADGVKCDSLTSTMKCAKQPTEIRFRFSGGQCFQSTNKQDNEMKCMSAFSGTDGLKKAVVTIMGTGVPGLYGGANHLYYTRTHTIGDEFVVKGTGALQDTPGGELRKEITVVIQDEEGKVRQSMKLQMDCGQYKLAYRDVFGALEVKNFVNAIQGSVPTAVRVNYMYKVDNTGPLAADVTRFDSSLNGVAENLLSDIAESVGGGDPLVNVCDSVGVVKTKTVNLTRRASYLAKLAVNAVNEAGLACGGSADLSFSAGDG